MSEFSLVANRASPAIPIVGADAQSHTRVLQLMREAVMLGERRTSNLEASFVRVSELVALGLVEIQGSKLVVAKPQYPPVMTTGERDSVANPSDGMLIYNSTTGQFEGRAAGAWVAL